MNIAPIIANTIWVSVPFLLAGLFVAHKWRWKWFLACMTATVGIAYYRQVIVLSDMPYLLSYLHIGTPILSMLTWVLYGELLRLQGGLRWPTGERWSSLRAIFPFVCGAFLGELAAAALLAPQVKDGQARARVVLSAMAGGLVSPIGDANIFILHQSIPNLLLYMIPMGLLALLIIRPQPDDFPVSSASEKGLPLWLLFIPIVIYLLLPVNAPLILLEASLLLGLYSRRQLKNIDVGQLMWFALFAGMLSIATAGGLPELIAIGSENIVLNHSKELPVLLGFGGAFAGMLVDGTLSAVFVQAFIDRALDLSEPKFHFALAAGFAMGGIFPLVIGRCVKHALKTHILLMGVGLLYIYFVSNWLYQSVVS